ncbi:MAG: PAS domain S-box protein [Ignavibacteria bacterium]|nr:PAS domain S-box protein [Ignavibacteria bacterium]
MKRTVKYYQAILERIISGIALFKVIRDEKNNVIDFIILDANKAFEEITGFKRDIVLGRKASESIPNFEKRIKRWLTLPPVECDDYRKTFEYNSLSTNKWFRINVFYLDKEYFITEFQEITDLVNARKETIERESNFREFFDSPGVLRALCKINNNEIYFLEVNKELAKYFNFTQEEIRGKSFSDLKIPERIRTIWLENFSKSEELKSPVTFEYLNSKNQWRYAVSHFIGKDDFGHSKFSLAIQDITDKKNAEQELRLSEEKFSKAFSSSPYAICFTRFDDGTILDVNEGFLKITGYEYNQIIGKTTLEYGIWLDPKDRQDLIKELTTKGRVVQREYKFKVKSGKVLTGLLSAELININDVKCIISSVLDITERKNAEIALKESEERFRKIFDEAPVGMVLLDNNFNYIRVNNAFCSMVRYNQEELLNLSFRNIVDFEYIPVDEEYYRKLFSGEISVYKTTKKYITKDKNVFWGESSTSLIRDTEGNPSHLIEMIEDVTHKRTIEQNLVLAKERAEEMNRIKSNFLAQMSHELRTPMVGIIGFSDILKENLKEKHLIEFAEKINKSSKRLLDTLNQLLDLSIIEAKKLKVKYSTFNVIKEIKDVVTFFESFAKEKNLELKFESEYDDLLIYSDVALIRQILNNLINNSIKYTNQGHIKVKLTLEEKEKRKFVCITVEDTGIGIPKEKQDIIWDSFRQVSEGHGRTFEGVGLGLTITKNLVNTLDGEIYLKESNIDKGSVFVVLLPYLSKKNVTDMDSISEDISKQSEDILHSGFPLPDVLYVEDDREAVIIVNNFLKGICNIDVAINAVDGINQAKIKKYDIILMDINFRTGMDGLQAVEEIRKIPWYENVPIVAVTAFAMDKDKKEFLERGCTHYISKPFSRDEFVTFIRNIIRNIKTNIRN